MIEYNYLEYFTNLLWPPSLSFAAERRPNFTTTECNKNYKNKQQQQMYCINRLGEQCEVKHYIDLVKIIAKIL